MLTLMFTLAYMLYYDDCASRMYCIMTDFGYGVQEMLICLFSDYFIFFAGVLFYRLLTCYIAAYWFISVNKDLNRESVLLIKFAIQNQTF